MTEGEILTKVAEAPMGAHVMTRDEILAKVSEEGIRFIRLLFTDIVGFPKCVTITSDELEDALEQGLEAIAAGLRPEITLVPAAAGTDIAAWTTALQSVPVDPAMVIFDSAKFSRLMKGRLWFYARAPSASL